MTMIRHLILLLGLVAAGSAASSCHLREVTTCLTTLAAFARRTAGPVDLEADFQDKCEAVLDVSYCIGNYTRDCMTDDQIEMYEYVMDYVRHLHKRACSEDSDLKAGYFKHHACLKSLWGNRDFRSCIKDVKVGLEVILNAKYTKRPDLKCCTLNRYKECATAVTIQACGQETMDFMTTVMRMGGSRFLDIYCSGIDGNGKECDAIPPPGSPLVGSKSKSPYKILSGLLYLSEY